ncbi:MAG: esterase family protein [Clostridia bacterium]|nr:esterase family protein [Clostridia bacterium]
MAFLQMDLYSESLGQTTSVNVLLPEKREGRMFRTLWLLHGLTDGHDAWMRYTSVERYAKRYGLAVVMPSADRSWYTDTAYGKNYFTWITEELPEKIARLFCGYSAAREDNLIIGLSMGGYGALKAALTCPERYGFCASLSGSLDVTRKNRPYNLDEWRSIFGFELRDAADLAGSEHDLFALASRGGDFPPLFLWCGTEDSLVEINRAFSAHLTSLGVAHTLKTSEGDHSWKWWDLHLKTALEHRFSSLRS